MPIVLIVAAVVGGFAGYPWLTTLVSRRTQQPLTRRQRIWVSPLTVVAGSALAAALGLVEAPLAIRIGLVASAVIGWYLLCIDLALHKLPDPLVAAHFGTVAVSFLVAFVMDQVDEQVLIRAIVGGGAGFGLFLILSLVGRRSLGFGDVKLAGPLGMMTGAFGAAAFGQWLVLSFLLGGLFAVFLLATRRMTAKESIAFGPWMILGAYGAVALNGLPQL